MFCKNCGVELNARTIFCKNCGKKIASLSPFVTTKNKFFSWLRKKIGLVIFVFVVVFLLLVIIGLLPAENHKEYSTNTVPVSDPTTQSEIAASVVNIFCPSTLSEEEVSGGSGTILSEDGIILTNSHIIPQDEENIYVGKEGCLIVLPDPATGQPSEVYLAHPIVIPSLSDDYDLAFMEIYAAFYNEEDQTFAGTYPRVFPAFDDTARCKNENVQLGEPVRIFGYPAISGGYSLTITDGIISSFPGKGLIITSAKISHGNSGGLAVDRHGCMLGVPSLVSVDEYESLGVIISMDLINKFTEEVIRVIDSH